MFSPFRPMKSTGYKLNLVKMSSGQVQAHDFNAIVILSPAVRDRTTAAVHLFSKHFRDHEDHHCTKEAAAKQHIN